MKNKIFASLGIATILFCGCQGYKLGSSVPQNLRAIAIPNFENTTEFPQFGTIATQQLLDVVISDGTFRPVSSANSDIKVIGSISNIKTASVRYDRNKALLTDEYRLNVQAKIFVIETKTGKTLINGATVSADTTFQTGGDMLTGEEMAYPRVAKNLAVNILDLLQTISN